jgi:type II secretory pathway pseudopilin PulG
MRPARRQTPGGYAIIAAMIATLLLTILLLAAAPMWERILLRDQESELMFRAREYVRGIEKYLAAHNNTYPQNLEVLFKEKCVRKLYSDPMSDDGKWDLVMLDRSTPKQKLTIVADSLVGKYLARAVIVGVCSSSTQGSYRIYRGKNKYNEWAFYIGAKEEDEMPELAIAMPSE